MRKTQKKKKKTQIKLNRKKSQQIKQIKEERNINNSFYEHILI